MRVRVFVFDEFTDAREAEVNDIGDEGGFGVFPFLFPLGIGECGFLFMNPSLASLYRSTSARAF